MQELKTLPCSPKIMRLPSIQPTKKKTYNPPPFSDPSLLPDHFCTVPYLKCDIQIMDWVSTCVFYVFLSESLYVFPISSTGLPSSMAYVNRMVKWRLTAPDCSPLTESLWCVPSCFLCSVLNVLIFPWIKIEITANWAVSSFSNFFF